MGDRVVVICSSCASKLTADKRITEYEAFPGVHPLGSPLPVADVPDGTVVQLDRGVGPYQLKHAVKLNGCGYWLRFRGGILTRDTAGWRWCAEGLFANGPETTVRVAVSCVSTDDSVETLWERIQHYHREMSTTAIGRILVCGHEQYNTLDACQDLMDSALERWHDDPREVRSPHDALGLTFEEYGQWAVNPGFLRELLKLRQFHLSG